MSTSKFAAREDDSYMEYEDQTQLTAEVPNGFSVVKKYGQENPQLRPLSEFESLSAQLRQKPHNPAGWRKLLRIAEDIGDINNISTAYDALLAQYPNHGTLQIQYISHFLDVVGRYGRAQNLLEKFLIKSPCVELWCVYLAQVRRFNMKETQRDNIRISYEFALNHVGQDKDSGQIWSDYIQFLKSGEDGTAWEEQQKTDALRKVYHRAVQIPLENVERLWLELEAFETGLNIVTAKQIMADLSPAHMQARNVLRQLIKHVDPLYATDSSEMYLPSLPRFDAVERTLVGKWKVYLKWEESNPLGLTGSQEVTLITRIQGVYRKALIRMRYYTEIWFMAYTWTSSVGKSEEAISILKAGLQANPSSFLLIFAYAEALEVKKEFDDVHALYQNFLLTLRANLEQLEGATTSKHVSVINESSQITDDAEERKKQLRKHRTEYGLACIMYMRFGMRAEGVKSSRTIFAKARNDRWTPWEVYEAAALMEYHSSGGKGVASLIFERGLGVFGSEIDYVLRYLGFLISINDENNARALFERVIPNFRPECARPLWEHWSRYEYQYGNLEASLKLEKRMAEVYTSDPPIKRLAQRHMYLGTDVIANRDLGFAIAQRANNHSIGQWPQISTPLLVSPQQTIMPHMHRAGTGGSSKRKQQRGPSPEYQTRADRRGVDYSTMHKRSRPASPPSARGPDRDRDSRRDGLSSRRSFSPPPAAWEIEERGSGRRGELPEPPGMQGREEEKPRQGAIPQVLSRFIGDSESESPTPSPFDDLSLRTGDLMRLFRDAIIPSTSKPKSPPPPPRAGGGRSPLLSNYGPNQGPKTGRLY